MSTIVHQHFLMASNGGHLTTLIKYPNRVDPGSLKEGDQVICWDDSDLADNPYIYNTPILGGYYEVREVAPESFGLRLVGLTNPEGPFPMEPGFELSRFCTVEDWEAAHLKMVKNYPHAKVKYNPLGSLHEVFYATSYEVSFDDFNKEDSDAILGGGTPFTSLRYTFEELTLNEPLEAYTTFSIVQAFGNYNLVKHTHVPAKHLFEDDIDSTRLVVILQDVPGVSYTDHAKVMLLLWLLYDRPEIEDIDSHIDILDPILVDTKEQLFIDDVEIEDLLDFSQERTIHEKVCRLLKIEL